jgi:molecular chaperone GrpE
MVWWTWDRRRTEHMSEKKAGKAAKAADKKPEAAAEKEREAAAAKERKGAADGQETEGQGASAEQASDERKEDGDARYMRLAADFQNYKKRTEKEKSDIYAFANEKFAADLLDVTDNFERAIDQDAASGADEKFIEGMKLIMEQLVNVLERNDVSEINALGEDFDPNLHHAVQMEESAEYGSGKVTKVIQKGYTMRDKVLRPAMVVVAR